ncbi:MAG: DNA recombination protein RmuC [Acidobacteriota bacterium]
MEILIIGILAVIILLVIGLLIFYFNQRLKEINQNLLLSQKNVSETIDSTSRIFGDVKERLGILSQSAERIFEIGKDISSLQEILKTPKLRGSIGELFLEDLLSQILPASNFSIQYKFKSGETVDAVIHLGTGMVPVDAKFPLENFRKMMEATDEEDKKNSRKKFLTDVKNHINSISAKYILPDEGTFDFALMYIPAENIYYETIIKDESFGEETSVSYYALKRHVIPVSPNSFFAYLQAIVLGLKGMRIEKSAKEIILNLMRLQGDFKKFQEDFEVMGRHLRDTRSKYEDAEKRLLKVHEKLTKITEIPESKELEEKQD